MVHVLRDHIAHMNITTPIPNVRQTEGYRSMVHAPDLIINLILSTGEHAWADHLHSLNSSVY